MAEFNGKINCGGTLNATIDFEPYTVDESHANYDALVECFQTNDADEFLRLYNLKDKFVEYAGEHLTIKGNDVLLSGESVPSMFVSMVLQMIKEAIDPTYVENFILNLMDNVSQLSINHLYDFLKHKNMPLTEDGCFLAYKAITNDYQDKWTRTLDYRIGNTIKEKRCLISDDRDVHCTNGLHAGSRKYAEDYARGNDRVVIVKINPRDVVAIPKDCSCQKLRCCEFTIIKEIGETDTLDGPVSSLDKEINLGNLVSYEGEKCIVIGLDEDEGYRIAPVSGCDEDDDSNDIYVSKDKLVFIDSSVREIAIEDLKKGDIVGLYWNGPIGSKGFSYASKVSCEFDEDSECLVCLDLEDGHNRTLDHDDMDEVRLIYRP